MEDLNVLDPSHPLKKEKEKKRVLHLGINHLDNTRLHLNNIMIFLIFFIENQQEPLPKDKNIGFDGYINNLILWIY